MEGKTNNTTKEWQLVFLFFTKELTIGVFWWIGYFLTFKRHFKPKISLKEHIDGILLIFFQLLYFLLKYGQNLHEVEGLKIGMDVIKSFRNCQPISEFFGLVLFFRESERVQFVW